MNAGWFDRLRRGPGAVDEARWVMVDVESSGLDASRDRLLAIAGVGLSVDWQHKRLAIVPADSFEAVLQQELASARANILVHGIGAQRQREGTPRAHALQAFERFAAAAPLLGFHAAFDRTLIERHEQAELGAPASHRWLDIDQLCAATHDHVRARSLDEWLDHFSIRCAQRHQAAADALAQCELLLRIWPRIAAECGSWRDVERLAARHRWIARG